MIVDKFLSRSSKPDVVNWFLFNMLSNYITKANDSSSQAKTIQAHERIGYLVSEDVQENVFI